MTATNKDGSNRGYWLAVALENGISKPTFHSRMYKQGWSAEKAATERVTGTRGIKKMEAGDAELMADLRESGMKVKDIAEKFDVTSGSVTKAIKRAKRSA